MSNVQNILLIASPKIGHTPAFDRAVELASACKAHLHIVAFDYMETLEFVGIFNHDTLASLREGYLQMHRHWLEQEAEYVRRSGVVVTTQLFWTRHIVDEIQQYAKAIQADMVLKDAHHESALKRVFFTPLDWQLLRNCDVPVHLVTSAKNPLPRKILATVNLFRSDHADLALNETIIDAASQLANQCEAALHMLYVYDWSAIYASEFTMMGAMPIEAGFVQALRDTHQEAFDNLAARHHIPKTQTHFLEGIPLSAIKRFAAENAIDVLVMGTLPHRNLDRILGDTAESILEHAPCSVLIVHKKQGA